MRNQTPLCAFLALVTALLGASARAAPAPEPQDLAVVRNTVQNAAKSRMADNDANVQIEIAALDPRLQLPACPSLDVDLPSTVAAAMTAKVSCPLPQWTIYVPVRVHAWGEAVVAAVNLPANRTLSAVDLTRARVDLFAASAGVLTDPKQAQGKVLRAGLVVGAPILSTMLEQPLSVHRGQRVSMTVSDSTMEVKTSVIALEDGRIGDTITVQNPDSQKTISATVSSDGGVAIKF